MKAAAAETSFLTSPGTSPEKRSALLSPPPLPTAVERPLVKNIAADPTATDFAPPEGFWKEPTSKNVAEPKPGQTVKTTGITKLRQAAATIPPTEGAGPSKIPSTLRSRTTLGQVPTKKNPTKTIKKGKDKPAKMTPVEYAEMLIERYSNPNRRTPNVSQHLRGRKIFYVGVDMRYAGDATKKKMEYVRTSATPHLTLTPHHSTLDSQAWWHATP